MSLRPYPLLPLDVQTDKNITIHFSSSVKGSMSVSSASEYEHVTVKVDSCRVEVSERGRYSLQQNQYNPY
jgi:hypothetical protein